MKVLALCSLLAIINCTGSSPPIDICQSDMTLGTSTSATNAACWSKNLVIKDSKASATLNVANIPGNQIAKTQAHIALPKITSIKETTAQASNLFAQTINWQQSSQLTAASSYGFRICPYFAAGSKPPAGYCDASSWTFIDSPQDGTTNKQGSNKAGQFIVQLGYSATLPEGSTGGLSFTLEVLPVYAETKTSGLASKLPSILKAQASTSTTYTILVGQAFQTAASVSNVSNQNSQAQTPVAYTTNTNGTSTAANSTASSFVATVQAVYASTPAHTNINTPLVLGGTTPASTIPNVILPPAVVPTPTLPSPTIYSSHWVDGNGNIYIADTDNFVIREVTASDGKIHTIAGITGTCSSTGDEGLATAATLCYPLSVALDLAGNLYIADTGNCKIRRIDAVTHHISTVAGYNSCNYTGDGGLATLSSLNQPAGIFIDGSNNLYIADTVNQAIRKVDAQTKIITTVAGTPQTSDYAGDEGPATSAKLNWPFAIEWYYD